MKKSRDMFIGFYDELHIIRSIDQRAQSHGLNRSGYLRQLIREKLSEE